jgi:hypothetical protein
LQRLLLIAIVLFLLLCPIGPKPVRADDPLPTGVYRLGGVTPIDAHLLPEWGSAFLISYQIVPAGLIRFEADLELLDGDRERDAEPDFAPQVFVVSGSTLYAGLGTGLEVREGVPAEKPFYSLKAGVDLEVLPLVYLDFNAKTRLSDRSLDELIQEGEVEGLSVAGMLRIQF